MMTYSYHLEKGGAKYHCPSCGKRRFVRYVNAETGEQLADDCGRCDRENSCSFHLRPSEWFRLTGTKPPIRWGVVSKQKPAPGHSFIETEVQDNTLQCYGRNNFAQWLVSVFGIEAAYQLADMYRVGTSKYWPGACIFWQEDVAGRIRTGKIMLYDAETGKRVKYPRNHVTWVHKVLKINPFRLRQCLFGEHLLAEYQNKPIALVESEKTAIVAAGFIPEYVWLATGGKGNLNKETIKVLRGRSVTLFPDLGAFEKWSEIVKGIPGFMVSDILERHATGDDREKGLDIADFILREREQALTA